MKGRKRTVPTAIQPDPPQRLDWLARQLMPIVGQLVGARVDPSVYDWEGLNPKARAVIRQLATDVYFAVVTGDPTVRVAFGLARARHERLEAERKGVDAQAFQAAVDAERKAYAVYAAEAAKEEEAAEKRKKETKPA